MMAFRIDRGGYRAQANHDERYMLMGLARDVIYILGSDVEHEVERKAELAADADPLAMIEAELAGLAGDWENHDEEQEDAEYHDPHMLLDDAIERLLPDMSENPQEANNLRKLTEDAVAGAKIDNLVTFYTDLEAIPDNIVDVYIDNDAALTWMAALNDIRLVLSTRLEIDDDATANAAYERAQVFTSYREEDEKNLPAIETPEDMMAVLYAMTTWWQESLATAVRNKAMRR